MAQIRWRELCITSWKLSCFQAVTYPSGQGVWNFSGRSMQKEGCLITNYDLTPLSRCLTLWSVPPSTGSLLKSNKQLLSAYYLLIKNTYRRLFPDYSYCSWDEPRPLNSRNKWRFREAGASPKLNFLIRRTWTLFLINDHYSWTGSTAIKY